MISTLPLLLALVGDADAAGYHLLKLQGIYGTSEQEQVEAGFGASVVSDQLGFWMTFGDRTAGEPGRGEGTLVKEWWVEGSWWGYQLGVPDFEDIGIDPDSVEVPTMLFPYGYGRFGADRTQGKLVTADYSQHLAFSVPGIWGADARFFHVGPTAGVGANLTWWDAWRGEPGQVVSTGKITAEAGAVVGVNWQDTLYGQARSTFHYDLFGVHQTNLNVAGVAGVYLGKLGRPVGVELRGEVDLGNDTNSAAYDDAWSLQAVLYVKADVPEETAPDVSDEVLQLLERGAQDAEERGEEP